MKLALYVFERLYVRQYQVVFLEDDDLAQNFARPQFVLDKVIYIKSQDLPTRIAFISDEVDRG